MGVYLSILVCLAFVSQNKLNNLFNKALFKFVSTYDIVSVSVAKLRFIVNRHYTEINTLSLSMKTTLTCK